jgi:hypothetical protein
MVYSHNFWFLTRRVSTLFPIVLSVICIYIYIYIYIYLVIFCKLENQVISNAAYKSNPSVSLIGSSHFNNGSLERESNNVYQQQTAAVSFCSVPTLQVFDMSPSFHWFRMVL